MDEQSKMLLAHAKCVKNKLQVRVELPTEIATRTKTDYEIEDLIRKSALEKLVYEAAKHSVITMRTFETSSFTRVFEQSCWVFSEEQLGNLLKAAYELGQGTITL